jgi:hypothetical protein
MTPWSIILNNPGKLEHNGRACVAQSTLQDDPRLIRFDSPVSGIAALMKTLLSFQRKDDLEHIAAFIARYSSPDKAAVCVLDVCRHCGVDQTDYFDIEVPDNLIRLTQAIVLHEQGTCPDSALPFWYEEAVFEAAAARVLA